MLIGSKELIKDINHNLVLEAILSTQPISRASLSKKLGLTKATISNIVQNLITQNLVIEIGSDETSHGRKPILLSFHKKAGYAISVELGHNTISVLSADLQGEVYSYKKISTRNQINILEQTILQLIGQLKAAAPPSPYGLIGIIFLIHGTAVDNRLIESHYPEYSALNITEKVERYFHVPVFLKNVSSMSALAEYIEHYRHPNLVYLNLEDNLDLGIIMQNRLYEGSNDRAGRFNHFPIDQSPDSKSCSCGYKGCLHNYITEKSILKEFQNEKMDSHLTINELNHSYQLGDITATELIDRMISYITLFVNYIICAYAPSAIVLSGNLLKNNPDIMEQIELALPPHLAKTTALSLSKCEPSPSLLGGIYYITKKFLHLKNYPGRRKI